MTSVHLKVMGSGPLSGAIQNYIQDHGLQNVQMLGFTDGEEKYRILSGALCCVVPSECYETFGFPVIESAAVGTPVVASRIGSLTRLVADDNRGLLFRPGDSADLRAKLELLVASPERVIRMGGTARHWVETKYTPDAYYQSLMKIYQDLAQEDLVARSRRRGIFDCPDRHASRMLD